MRRVLMGLTMGLLLGAAAYGEEPTLDLTEVEMATSGQPTAFKIPQEYGRLAGVVINSEVHYLYFEDGSGTIRVVLLGPRSAIQRARTPLQLLSPEVPLIKRGRGKPSHTS